VTDDQLMGMFQKDYLVLAGQIIPRKDKLRTPVLELLAHAKEHTRLFPASTKYHHRWPGGLADHITQVMALMMQHRHAMPDTELWQIPVVAYLHDWEKHWKYVPIEEDDREWNNGSRGGRPDSVFALSVVPAFRYNDIPGKFDPSVEMQAGILMERFKIPVSRKLSNALMLSEGGWSPHAAKSSLDKFATVLHSADMISSHCYQEVQGAGARRWTKATHQRVIDAYRTLPDLGEGTCRR
jgi:hypothetical protein